MSIYAFSLSSILYCYYFYVLVCFKCELKTYAFRKAFPEH